MNSSGQRYTIRGDSYSDCVAKIREEYGENYIIVNKRAVHTGGFLGLFKHDQMEVIFTVRDMGPYRSSRSSLASDGSDSGENSGLDAFSLEKKRILEAAKKAGLESQQNQMTSIQKQLETLNRKLDTISSDTDVPASVRKIEELLESNEFSAVYIRKMTERLKGELSLDELENFDFVQQKVVEWIGEGISVDPEVELTRKPVVLVLVGPTGVGKTTTVAKMAAKYRLSDKNLFIRMVTIDRFRIAAQEQLSIYGEHMEIPTTAAETAEDIQKLLAIDGDKLDVMLIDTIGLSPHDYESIGRMRKILDVPGLRPEMYLAISAATKTSDLRDIMRNYETFGYKSVIVTKYDETNHIGNVISILAEKNKPVSYISSGQIVPRNFESASVMRFLMKLTDFKIDRDSLEKRFAALPEDNSVVLHKTTNGGME